MELIRQLTSAVAAAHAQGIIHRDLEPANVLLSSDPKGNIVCNVADFGLAKWVDAESSATKTGSVIGSPAYMAPEQADGCSAEIAYQADVYSLGASLFHLLTERPATNNKIAAGSQGSAAASGRLTADRT